VGSNPTSTAVDLQELRSWQPISGRVVLPWSHLVVSVTSRMRSHRRAEPQMSCLVTAIADAPGGGADVGDGREQGVLPEAIGLLPGDLIKQVRFGPVMEAAAASTAIMFATGYTSVNGAPGTARRRQSPMVTGTAAAAGLAGSTVPCSATEIQAVNSDAAAVEWKRYPPGTDRELQHRAAPGRPGGHGHHGTKNRRTTHARMGLAVDLGQLRGPRCG
jgi:hypothetical protein